MEASKLPVRIHVSRMDIARAVVARDRVDYTASRMCPIAQAISRRYPGKAVVIGFDSSDVSVYSLTNSKGVMRRIRMFDNRSNLGPFTLLIDPKRKKISIA